MNTDFSTELRRAISQYKMNKNIPDVDFLSHLFANLDFEKRDTCNYVDFVNIMTKIKLKGKHSLRSIFSKFDKQGVGKIRYSHFCKYFLTPKVNSARKPVIQPTIEDPSVDRFVDYLLSISPNAYLNIYKEFLKFDVTRLDLITVEQFSKVIGDNKVKISVKDCQRIFHRYENEGKFRYADFFKSINVLK